MPFAPGVAKSAARSSIAALLITALAVVAATFLVAAPLASASAPPMVKRVIAAANRIRTTPYIWGGGHGRWQDSGYDCSGAVSYALHGARMLTTPLTSGSF